jgi:NAD(P)-dependent dehydrogenase (short-subunit alcohol dehydrogenase family)
LSLEGRVAIITGGGTGIGFGIARVLAEKGVALVLAQRRKEPLEEAANRLSTLTSVLTLQINIASASEAEKMVEKAIAAYGRLDLLVNNASITGPPALRPILDSDSDHVDQVVDVNLKGTFYCSRAAARQMVLDRRGGNIIHISSVGAYAAQQFASLYCATKAAQVALARSMALELAQYGIRVNCVAPGDVPVHTAESAVAPPIRFGRNTPWVRLGVPEDIGHAVAYLASDEAAFVTGTTLIVDGGWLTY